MAGVSRKWLAGITAKAMKKGHARGQSNARWKIHGSPRDKATQRSQVAHEIRALRSKGYKGGKRGAAFAKSVRGGQIMAKVSRSGVKYNAVRKSGRISVGFTYRLKPRSAKQIAASRANGAKGGGSRGRRGRR